MKNFMTGHKRTGIFLFTMGLAGASVSGAGAWPDASAAAVQDHAYAQSRPERADKSSNRLRYDEPVRISGRSETDLHYWMHLPTGRSHPRVAISGTINADVYMKRGSAPTTTDFDCSSSFGNPDKSCGLKHARDGTYYVMVRGSSEFHGRLVAHWDSIFPE